MGFPLRLGMRNMMRMRVAPRLWRGFIIKSLGIGIEIEIGIENNIVKLLGR